MDKRKYLLSLVLASSFANANINVFLNLRSIEGAVNEKR